jgi:hypothetical protein
VAAVVEEQMQLALVELVVEAMVEQTMVLELILVEQILVEAEAALATQTLLVHLVAQE